MKKDKFRKNCVCCGNVICGGDYCSNCAKKQIIIREIQTMVRNEVRKHENRKQQNHRSNRNRVI